MDPDAIVAIAQGGAGAIATLAFFVAMFIRGYIVPRPFYDDLMADRDYWRSVADRALTAGERLAPSIDAVKRQG
jgi:hypothetical protein